MKNNQKISIGIGVLAVIILLAWAPWISYECAIDKTVEKIGGQETYYCMYGSGGGSIYDEFAVSWIPFGRFVANYENYWLVFFYNCVIPEEKPKQITEEEAISIAKATDEVQEFLKLYPDADVLSSLSCCAKASVVGEKCTGARNPLANWVVIYHKGIILPQSASVKIAINSTTGEILAKYPNLEYIKNSKYCEKHDDCILIEPICGNLECTPDNLVCEQMCKCATSINFIHRIRWNETRDKIFCNNTKLCEMCAPINSFEAKCINNTCVAVEKINKIRNGKQSS